jgi:hypothetical protein
MFKVISATWNHSPSYNIHNTTLYKTFCRYNPSKDIVNIHFDRGHFNEIEHKYHSTLGTQGEFILYKVDLLRQKVAELDTDYIIFCDANDVTVTNTISNNLFDLFDLDNRVIFSGERNDWPKDYMTQEWPNYKGYNEWDKANRMFLNSGVQLAKKTKYLELLDACVEEVWQNKLQGYGGDQGVFTWHYNMNNCPAIQIDTACNFAISTYDSDINQYYRQKDKIISSKHGTAPLFIHDNGTNYGGKQFARNFNLI